MNLSTFGVPIFALDMADRAFPAADPTGQSKERTWEGRRVARITVPLIGPDGKPSGFNLLASLNRDTSPDGKSYAMRVSLPTIGGQYQSGISADAAGGIDELRYTLAEQGDTWFRSLAQAQAQANAPKRPRLVVIRSTEPEPAAPTTAQPPAPEVSQTAQPTTAQPANKPK